MKVKILPSDLSGNIYAPASKSSMQRACAAALLHEGKSVIENTGHSNDDKAAVAIIESLGATVRMKDDKLFVESNGVSPRADEINCGESGLSIRMFTAIAALSDKKIKITGEGSLLTRPMDFFDKVLPQLGVTIKSNNGKLPITIQGPLQPVDIIIDGSMSSQFLTGLLMVYGAPPKSSPKGRTFEQSPNSKVAISVRNLKSKPYIDLTLDVMKQFGLNNPENKNYEEFSFKSAIHNPQSEIHYIVEGDWSGGAFLLVAGAIAGNVTVRGLDMMSTQADKAIIQALSQANANLAIESKGIKIGPGKLKAFEFDATDCPDLFPPLVALAAYCNGRTSIKGVSRLVHKESDRSVALQLEFEKLGVNIELKDDIMVVEGGKGLREAVVHSHYDHRIAMACAVAALKANGETVIEEAQAVKKSYPDFYDDLKKLGANVSLPFQHFK